MASLTVLKTSDIGEWNYSSLGIKAQLHSDLT